MNVDAYLGHVPAIEKSIADHKLDALVCGMGPTAWLLPWMDRSLIAPLRLWGCHDACRVLPMDDLVIMDSAVNALHPDTTRYAEIVKARPKRLWVYDRNWPSWNGRIHPSVVKVMKTVPWAVCDPRSAERTVAAQRTKTFDCIPFKLEADPIQTTAISPTGMTPWRGGKAAAALASSASTCRRVTTTATARGPWWIRSSARWPSRRTSAAAAS